MTRAYFQNPKSKISHSIWWMVAILLLAAAFRFLAIDTAPPGWRDDELIEYNMDRRIADGWRPLFISEAEGHEPVYHYLHAGTLLLFGDNIVGYKWLPVAFGLLTIALTYSLARKMFGAPIALLTAALLAVSFWPIMYSRFGVRHIGVLPWMLGAFYLLYPSPSLEQRRRPGTRGLGTIVAAGICLAAVLMTYFAGRAVPIVLVGFLGYLLIFQRAIFKQVWGRYLLAIGIAVLIALPMFAEIANTPGGEKRTEVVGGPLIELRNGKVQSAIDTTLGTLGMFTVAGDPESLYNVPGRPVFDWITGIFFYLGFIFGLIRLKRIESGFALTWLIVGIAPAFVSIPAASFSHTIVALPVMYMLAAVGVVEVVDKAVSRQGNMRLALSTYLLVSSFVVVMGAWLTIRDYFGTWANDPFVRFQYHAPIREVAKWLDQQAVTDVAVGTNPNELQLDPLALKLDLRRAVAARWFNAETALVTPSNGLTVITSMQTPRTEAQQVLADRAWLQQKQSAFEVYAFKVSGPLVAPPGGDFDQGRLVLRSIDSIPDRATAGDGVTWRTTWLIDPPLSQPRLKLFLHILNDTGEVVASNDREDFNFSTLGQGDGLIQISQVTLPPELPPGEYQVEMGWYNPVTGVRLKREDGADRYLLSSPLKVGAP